jgi:hypothetical protein
VGGGKKVYGHKAPVLYGAGSTLQDMKYFEIIGEQFRNLDLIPS